LKKRAFLVATLCWVLQFAWATPFYLPGHMVIKAP